MELDIGVDCSRLAIDREEDDALGVPLDAKFDNGIRAILIRVDMGDVSFSEGGINCAEKYVGVGLGYVHDNCTVAVYWGVILEDIPIAEEDLAARAVPRSS